MESFEELGLPAELVDALAAEGIERPTPLQRDLIPLLRRGNNALARAGPGSGTLVAYGAPLLERIEAGGAAPAAVVLAASQAAAAALAGSLARLALATGHAVAALGSTWASPEKSDILFATAADLLASVRTSRLRLEDLRALVVDGAATLQHTDGLDDLETLAAFLPATAQRVVISLPVTPEVASFARAHAKKAGHVAVAAPSKEAEAGPVRGVVLYRISRKDDADIVRTVAGILEEGARHVLVHCGSDDHAADVGDLLSLRGYLAGAPGDPSAPVWLGSGNDASGQGIAGDGADTAGVMTSDVATLSVDVPPGAASLSRRHGPGGTAVVLVASRELAHLKAVAAEAGCRLRPLPNPPGARGEPERRRGELLRILEEEDLTSEMLLLDPLFERHDPVEVAAAATRLAGRAAKGSPGRRTPAGTSARADGADAARRPASTSLPVRAQAWVRLFLSVGSRDGIRPGDLLRAAAGEAGIDRAQVGRIEIQDTFSRVEIRQQVAGKVLRALNGTTLGGRSVRVDYHREPARGGAKPGGGPKPGRGPKRGGGPGRRRMRPAS